MNWYKGIIVILVVTLVGYSAYLNDKIEKCEADATAMTQMAMEQREIAETANEVVMRERLRADSLAMEARMQRAHALVLMDSLSQHRIEAQTK